MGKKIDNIPPLSVYISDFINIVETAQKDFKWNYEEVNRLDRLTQDYLHTLELDNLDYNGRAKIATQLSKCRQLRRESKNSVEVLQPLIEFLDSDKGKYLLNILKEILGKTRKAETYIENRSYKRRVLQDNE